MLASLYRTPITARLVREAGADGKHDGVMVALMLNTQANAGAVKALTTVATEPRDNLHITLAYCGKKAELTPAQIEAIHRVTSAVTKARPALVGAVSGTSQFPASDTSDGKDVSYAKPSIDGLMELRQDLVTKLRAAGVPVSDKHPFNPHITLAYRDTDSTEPSIEAPHVPLTFGALTVVVGDDHTSHVLEGQTMRHAAQGVREGLSSFIARYTAPVAAVVREGITAGTGSWITLTSDEGIETHCFVGGHGMVTKGPKSLVGSNIAHLPAPPHRVNHPVGHVPAGAKDHPSYTEHPSSQAKPKADKPAGAQESAIKNPGKPYARLHGADQGKSPASDEKGAQGASDPHLPHLMKELEQQSPALPAKVAGARTVDEALDKLGVKGQSADKLRAAAAARYYKSPEAHDAWLLNPDRYIPSSATPEQRASIEKEVAAAQERAKAKASEAYSAPQTLTDAEEQTVAHYTAHHMQKSPDEKRMVANNMESQHDERMQASGIHPAHPKHILAAAAAKLRDRADYEEGKGKYASTASEAHSAQEEPEPLTKEQAEAGLTKARAESKAKSAPTEAKASDESKDDDKPAPTLTKAAIQAKVMNREKLTDAEKAFVLGGYKAPKTDAPVGAKADTPKAPEKAAAEPKATDDGDIDNDYINRHLVLQRDFGKSFMSHLTFAMAA